MSSLCHSTAVLKPMISFNSTPRFVGVMIRSHPSPYESSLSVCGSNPTPHALDSTMEIMHVCRYVRVLLESLVTLYTRSVRDSFWSTGLPD